MVSSGDLSEAAVPPAQEHCLLQSCLPSITVAWRLRAGAQVRPGTSESAPLCLHTLDYEIRGDGRYKRNADCL